MENQTARRSLCLWTLLLLGATSRVAADDVLLAGGPASFDALMPVSLPGGPTLFDPSELMSSPSAQTSWDDFNSPSYQSGLDPAWQAGPTASPPIKPASRMFGSVDIGVPLVLNVNHELIRPGANLHAQGGIDLGYVGFFLHGGWRFIPVDFDRAADSGHPEYEGEGRDPLKNPYFGLGLRGQIPNRTRIMPYASVSFDFNWWNFKERAAACSGGYYYWWCDDYDVYRFTPGFSGRAGSAIYVTQGFYVDFGLGVSMSFEGDFFDKDQVWLEPYAGLLFRR